MDHTLFVSHVQGAGGLTDDGGHRRQIEPRVALEAVVEALSLQLLHHDVGLAVLGGVEVDDLHDVGVPQSAGDPRLPVKAAEGDLVRGGLRDQQLDGEAALKALVRGLVDLAHAALPQQTLESVGVIEDRSDGV